MAKEVNQDEILYTKGHFLVVRGYSNKWDNTYGDVYSSEKELLEDHPECVILNGFYVVDGRTGWQPNDAANWHDDLETAKSECNDYALKEIE